MQRRALTTCVTCDARIAVGGECRSALVANPATTDAERVSVEIFEPVSTFF